MDGIDLQMGFWERVAGLEESMGENGGKFELGVKQTVEFDGKPTRGELISWHQTEEKCWAAGSLGGKELFLSQSHERKRRRFPGPSQFNE